MRQEGGQGLKGVLAIAGDGPAMARAQKDLDPLIRSVVVAWLLNGCWETFYIFAYGLVGNGHFAIYFLLPFQRQPWGCSVVWIIPLFDPKKPSSDLGGE